MLSDPVVMAASSLVLKGSSDVRAWFGQYIKLNQHKVSTPCCVLCPWIGEVY